VLNEIKRSEVGGLTIEEVVVVDKDRARAEQVAKSYGCRWANDLNDVVRMKVDAAIVAVPTVYHYEVSMKLLPYMDVLVEKPIAARLEEALEMGRLAEREGRLLAVGHVERFNPVVAALKERIGARVREVVHISAQRVGPGPPSGYTLNLGVAHDLLVHDIDIACYLLRAVPDTVLASAVWDKASGLEIDVVALYRFEGLGVTSDFRASWRASTNFKRRVLSVQMKDELLEADYILQTIVAERGLAEHRALREYSDLVSAYTSKVRESWSLLGVRKEPLLLEDAHFLQCAQRGEKPINSWEDGYRALKCVLAALDSAKRGEVVRMEWEI